MPEKVLKSPDLGFLEKRGDPVPDVSSVYQQEKSGKLISAQEIRENSGKFIKSSGTRENFTILIFFNYVLFIIVSVRNFSDK